jgi:hypothetical protein
VTVSQFLPNTADPQGWRDYVSNWMENSVGLLGFEGDRVSNRIRPIAIDSIGY